MKVKSGDACAISIDNCISRLYKIHQYKCALPDFSGAFVVENFNSFDNSLSESCKLSRLNYENSWTPRHASWSQFDYGTLGYAVFHPFDSLLNNLSKMPLMQCNAIQCASYQHILCHHNSSIYLDLLCWLFIHFTARCWLLVPKTLLHYSLHLCLILRSIL